MSLRRNVINLFVVQVISYLVPLLQLPYLSRVLGVDAFGLYVFSYSLISFLLIVTNFGFDVFLPQKILSQKIDEFNLSKIFSETLIVRSFLFAITVFIVVVLTYFNKNLKENKDVSVAIVFSVLGNAYSLLWLFQAKEAIYIYARINLVAKALSMLLIYIFVNSNDDIGMAIFFIGIGNLFAVICSKYWAYSRFSIRFVKISWSSTFYLVQESFEFFASRVFLAFYAVAGGAILGIFSNSLAEVAYYGAAQQLYAAGVYAMSALSTPLAPYMARTKNFNVFFKVTALAFGLTLLGSLFGLIFGEEIIVLIFGDSLIPAKNVLDVFMLTILFSIIGIQFGYPALQPLGKVKYANRSVVVAGVLQLIVVLFLFLCGTEFNAITVATTYLLCDLVMTLFRVGVFFNFYLRK